MLRTGVLNHWQNNGSHGETSTSSVSPPFENQIIKPIAFYVKQESM
jgi:hypothetical protein